MPRLSSRDGLRGSPRASRRRSPGRRRCRERGDSLAFVIVWPLLVVAAVVLVAQALIVSNARAQAELAASAGLRAAWRHSAAVHPGDDQGSAMAEAALNAAAVAASSTSGWRWWQPDATTVHSDWCSDPGSQPASQHHGWVRVVVTGEVIAPLDALWPEHSSRVSAAATGPAVLFGRPDPSTVPNNPAAVPAELAAC